MFDYTPKARRTRRRWRRLVPVLVGVIAIAGIGTVVASNGGVIGGPASSTTADPTGIPSPEGEASSGPAASSSAATTQGPAVAVTEPPPSGAPPLTELTGYQWPLPHGRLTLPFGPSPWGSRVVDGELFHDGIDLATFCGDKIVAAHAGTVLAASRRYDDQIGWIGDLTPYKTRLDEKKLWGTLPIVIVIDDGNGYRSVYAHFREVVVKRGDAVTAGQFIGYEGATGRASGCHVHYTLFSPLETATFGIDADVVKRMKLPDTLIARIDPLLILPPRPQDQPTPSPGASSDGASPMPSLQLSPIPEPPPLP